MSARTSLPVRSEQIFGALILIALFFFEIFNYSTTDFALHDLLGDLAFFGIKWSTILAIAFCGIDFAGIARLFNRHDEQPTETWYLLGAWLLAASMNAMLTWWGVSVALLQHVPAGASVLGTETVRRIVPVFVAILVWLVRVLIIGTISVAGPQLFGGWAVPEPRPRRRSVSTVTRRPATVRASAVRARTADAYLSGAARTPA
ncbi:MAG: hypothetical protein GXO37_00870, partial [Chloroflexi bacterium]|nr:hypothetical protein [Chloroflexota bacterium]